jgi:hypothetical protein
MAKILIAVNTLTEVNQLAYLNHNQMWYRFGRDYPEHDFVLFAPRRMSIDNMRNFAGKSAIDLNCDWLIFLDDDVLTPIETGWLRRMIEYNKDVIAGVTCIRGYPYHPMIFNFMKRQLDSLETHFVDNYKALANPEGFSLCLIKVDTLRKISKPYFITGINHTEDVYFCNKMRKEILGSEVWVDTTCETAHILGSDIIMPMNVEARKKFDEDENPGLKEHVRVSELRQPIIDPKVFGKGSYEEYVVKETWK